MIVHGADGAVIGQIVQKIMIGNIRFDLESGGSRLGSIRGEDWKTWDFNVQDATGTEIARITKTWAGMATGLLRNDKRDKYVVEIHASMDEPLRTLVIAAALAIDTALRQN